LSGADIVVFNDNDPAGYEHATATCELSVGVAKRVRRLDLKPHWGGEMPKGADVSDWLAQGHSREELMALMASAPDYTTDAMLKAEQPEQPQPPLPQMLPSPSAPMAVARKFVERRCLYNGAPDELTLRHWHGVWWTWQTTHWIIAEERAIRALLYAFTEHAVYLAHGQLKP